MSFLRIFSLCLLSLSCGSMPMKSGLKADLEVSSGKLKGSKNIVSAEVNYKIDFSAKSIGLKGKAKALGLRYDINYNFLCTENLLETAKMLDRGVGYAEALEGDEGFVAEITNITQGKIEITVSGEDAEIVIYSSTNEPRLNITKARVKVSQPVDISLDLRPVSRLLNPRLTENGSPHH